MLTPVEILKKAVALILPNTDTKTRDQFLVNLVDNEIYCQHCEYYSLGEAKETCPRCDRPL